MKLKQLLLVVLLILSVFLVVSCISPTDVNNAEEESTAEETSDEEAEVEVAEEAKSEGSKESDETSTNMEDSSEQTRKEDMVDSEEEMMEMSEGDITSYGPNGFDVYKYTIAVGESVTFVNANKGDDKNLDISLTFQNPNNKRQFVTSDQFGYGESTSVTFDEAGVWTGWTVEYGVKLEITVI
jgi:plastocyanin